MGPHGSSQAAGFGGIARQRPGGLARSDRDAATTGRCGGAGTGRPHGLPRLDLATKPWAPVPDLVKLEPLTEPPSSYRKMESTDPQFQVTYVGLDVAKDRLDYTVDGIRCAHVPNTSAGHARLAQHLPGLFGREAQERCHPADHRVRDLPQRCLGTAPRT